MKGQILAASPDLKVLMKHYINNSILCVTAAIENKLYFFKNCGYDMHLGNKAEETNRTGHHTEVGAIKKRTNLLSFLTSADDILDLF